MSKIWRAIYGVYFWLIFATLGVLAVLLVAITPGLTRRRTIAKYGASGIFTLTCLRPRIQVNGLEEPCVVVANHASYLDGVLLCAVLPPRFIFVIKREVASVPVVRLLLRRIGAAYVDRFDPRQGATDARRLLRAARDGYSLAFFPEGTFSKEPGLQRFHAGAFRAAARANLPIVPVVIQGTRAVLPDKSKLPRTGNLVVLIKAPVFPTGRDNGSVRQLKALTRESMLEDLKEPDLLSHDNAVRESNRGDTPLPQG